MLELWGGQSHRGILGRGHAGSLDGRACGLVHDSGCDGTVTTLTKTDTVKVVTAVLIQRKCKPYWIAWDNEGEDRRGIRLAVDHSFYCHIGGTTRPPKDAKMWCGVPFETTVKYLA